MSFDWNESRWPGMTLNGQNTYVISTSLGAQRSARDSSTDHTYVKGTLHSKLTLGFFSWLKSIYYFELSLTSFTFVKLELKVQGTHFYGDAGEFDGCRGINLGIWSQWLMVISRNWRLARLGNDSSVHSYGDYGITAAKSVNKIKSNTSEL